MNPFQRIALFLIVCLACSCASTKSAHYLQGTWRVSGNQGAGRAWFKQWRFDDGKFELLGYPPLIARGSYKILSERPDTIILELKYTSGHFKGKSLKKVLRLLRADSPAAERIILGRDIYGRQLK